MVVNTSAHVVASVLDRPDILRAVKPLRPVQLTTEWNPGCPFHKGSVAIYIEGWPRPGRWGYFGNSSIKLRTLKRKLAALKGDPHAR